MRIAILAVTEKGFELAEKISAGIGGQIFIKGRDFERMKNFVEEIFTKFDALIFHSQNVLALYLNTLSETWYKI